VSASFWPAGEPSGPGSWPGMRASDADRDRVMEVLRVAARDGRLTPDELDERLEAALSSRTIGDLALLTADLVAEPGTPGGPGGPGVAVAQPEDLIRIDQRGGSVRRTGRWVVPRRLELSSSWCDVWLDFTGAVITHDRLLIDMNMRGGSLILLTGPGLVVDADALKVRYADVKIRPGAAPAAPVTLRVQLVGRMRYGWIEQR
jgi:Domain of unknown function (DUF1707)